VQGGICKIIGRVECKYKKGYTRLLEGMGVSARRDIARSLGGLSVSTRRNMQDHWEGWV